MHGGVHSKVRILVLGLGNDILADDAVGVLAAQRLMEPLRGRADVVSTAMHGVALLDLFLGYDRAVLIDAICTGQNPPGTILRMKGEDMRPVGSPSPHFSGIPEMLTIARELDLDFPREFDIFAIEVADPFTIGGAMSPAVQAALPKLCERICQAVEEAASRETSSLVSA